MSKLISLIVSAYNEQDGLHDFYETARDVLESYVSSHGGQAYDYQILFVNDGSTDRTADVLKELRAADPGHVTAVSFSRNFGHESAMTAGLDYARGDYLIFMDADLQHPPRCIPEIMDRFEAGFNVINMVRTRNEQAGAVSGALSKAFYRIINMISDAHLEPAASDFFALDKTAATVLREHYREKVRFLRGYVQNIGFNKTIIDYEAGERQAGKSHYNFGRLLKLSLEAMFCFSDLPLKLGIYAGLGAGALGFLVIIDALVTRKGAPSGYATIVIVMCFMFAMLFMLLGIIGSYISVLFREMRDRPIYIVENIEDGDLY